MNILIAALPLVLLSGTAFAGTLRCSFTEPFFSIAYDSATKQVTLVSPDESDPETGELKPRVIAEGARVRRPSAWQDHPKLILEAPAKADANTFEPIVEMTITGAGSDGMSDFVFPFEGKYGINVGGCESDKAPAYDAAAAFDDLGVIND